MSTAEHDSLWHRAAHTPARDWLRGRVTGRLDWRGVIAGAELPGPVAGLITRVVRRSRLWRLEKVDLAAELCAHFTDGLASGQAQEGLMRDFGSPTDAARLIRRAARRRRHWTARAFTHTLQGLGTVLLAMALAYALLAWRFYTGQPSITRNYTAEYNETIDAIPEENRAWPLYIETYTSLERIPRHTLSAWPAIAPEHPEYPEALAYLERQQGVIETAHRAAARPYLGAKLTDAIDPQLVESLEAARGEEIADAGPSENPMVMSILLPELGHFRELARLLAFDAHVAAQEGESQRAARDIATMLGIAGHSCERPLVIADLVGLAIQALAIQTTGELISGYPELLSDEQLRELAHRHAAFARGEPRVDFTAERWFFGDLVQRVYTDDGNGDGHVTAEGIRQLLGLANAGNDRHFEFGPAPLAPVAAAIVAGRADMTDKYDRFMTETEQNAALPMWEYDTRWDTDTQIELMFADPLTRTRYFPIVILMSALDSAAQAGERSKQTRDGLLAGIALELYRRDHGAYPAALDALVPGYLPAVTPDRFTGDPLRYSVSGGQANLWSVGVDRDDDGGRRPEGRDSTMHWLPLDQVQAKLRAQTGGSAYDGDWVLWPIVYRPIATPED